MNKFDIQIHIDEFNWEDPEWEDLRGEMPQPDDGEIETKDLPF